MRSALLTILGLLLAFPAGAQPRPPAVGVTGAVNPQAESTPPALASRTLFVGADLVMRERIRTGEAGTVQVVFVDRSTLAVGRNSDIVIDEFVFNPATDSGRMAATLTRGVLRYVGGRISHRDGVTVETPAGTIGIRGGTAMISIINGATQVLNIFGNVVLSNAGGSTRIIRPGFIAEMRSRSDAPGEARQASVQEIAQVMSLTDSGPGQGGGAPSRPGDTAARNAGTGQQQAGLQAQQLQPQAPQGGLAQPIVAANLPPGGPRYNGDPTLLRSGQLSEQNQLAVTVPLAADPTGFPTGITTLGDLRSVNVPLNLTLSQNNVGLSTTAGAVGSYNFLMQITLSPNAALRGMTVGAYNITVGGPNWSGPPVTNSTLNSGTFFAPPNFGSFPDGVGAFGLSTSCGANVDCALGVIPRTVGGRLVREVDHILVVYSPSNPTVPTGPAPSVAIGQGTATRP